MEDPFVKKVAEWQQAEIFRSRHVVEELPSSSIYWKDKNGVYLGCNVYAMEKIFSIQPGKGHLKNLIIGKTDYDLFPQEVADCYRKQDLQVMETKEALSLEESIFLPNGKTVPRLSTKCPFYNESGDVAGIVGHTTDMTHFDGIESELREVKEKLFQESESAKEKNRITNIFLKNITKALPQYIFWKDAHSVYLGCNENFAQLIGLNSPEEIIGKTDYDIDWKSSGHTAETFQKGDRDTMSGKLIINQEEILALPGGKKLITLVSKLPIVDKGEVLGVVGCFVDVTVEKEVARLKIENEIQKKSLEEQEKFTQIANQVAHDIRSPLASLLMVIKSCMEIPERNRIALREAAISIGDIANNLLNRYQSKELGVKKEERQPLLVSATIMQLLADKKYEYEHVVWGHEVSPGGHFAFIEIEPSSFKRMISNLINNAVDACSKENSRIFICLQVDGEQLKISIKDNGSGMPPEVLEKIRNHLAVTSGKKGGHGIGLTQVRDTLKRNQGDIDFRSTVGSGTEITLTFQQVKAPEWMAEVIQLKPKDTVIILDDDTSIHTAWETHFQTVLSKAVGIKLRHFHVGQKALDFIRSLSSQEKKNFFLLTDYELLKQNLDGLTVIEQSGIERSILVTSHYANPAVCERVARIGSKILPKQMASEIPIEIQEMLQTQESSVSELIAVDIVVVDDNQSFTNTLIQFAFFDWKVVAYPRPEALLESLASYSKDTKIVMDNQFDNSPLSGIELAERLHEQGYTRLYLLSGRIFEDGEAPDYLMVIRKDDIDAISRIAEG